MIFYYIGIPLAYILIGIAWGFFRWKRFVDNEVEFYEQERQRFLNHHRIRGSQIPDFLVFEWRHFVQATERLREVPPKPNDYQAQITFDVALWPLSMVLIVLQQTFSVGLKVILSEYNKITRNKIDRISKDLKG